LSGGATVALVSTPSNANQIGPAAAKAVGDSRARAGEPLGEVVTRRLRDAILEGQLRPGARIRQEAVARELGTSRIPVREALLQLENEGLVSLVPHSGARVAKLDFAEYTELYHIREQLEPLALAESTPRLSDNAIAQLRELMLHIEQTRDPATWLALDRRFHLASYAAAPMPRLLKMIEAFWNSTQQYRRAFYAAIAPPHAGSLAGDQPLTVVEHRLLFDALERRDPDDAESILRSHIRRTRLTLAGHQEVFDE
jgi:DNA-binding GntR family transcriptional regulator